MVRGLEFFRDYFKEHSDKYVLIGGVANYLALNIAGEEARVTKDLDIVLIAEAIDKVFVKLFWDFIKEGQYDNRQKSTGKKLFYRFQKPKNDKFPEMLELFSRIPDALDFKGTGHLTPIPVTDEVSSLSAILLNDSYYELVKFGTEKIDDIPFLEPKTLIIFKARAWLDLTDRKNAGENISEAEIKKHCNDIIKLTRIISPEPTLNLPENIFDDFQRFISAIENMSFNLKQFGYGPKTTLTDVVSVLNKIYSLRKQPDL